MMVSCSACRPPEALILSTAAFTPFNIDCPKAWYWPLIGPATPIIISARTAVALKRNNAAASLSISCAHLLSGRPRGNTLPMFFDFRQGVDVHLIIFQPSGQSVEINISHAELFAHHPWFTIGRAFQ